MPIPKLYIVPALSRLCGIFDYYVDLWTVSRVDDAEFVAVDD